MGKGVQEQTRVQYDGLCDQRNVGCRLFLKYVAMAFSVALLLFLCFWLVMWYGQLGVVGADTPPVQLVQEYSTSTRAIDSARLVPAQDTPEQASALRERLTFQHLAAAQADFISDGRTFIDIDLTEMTLDLYTGGTVARSFSVLTKGKEGSWWETPIGLYQVQLKKSNHFSSFGHVHQPWSILFHGNFFVHGWPYYPNGAPVASSYSGGCIRLDTNDARTLFDEVAIGTPVVVRDSGLTADSVTYTSAPTSTPLLLDARAHLVVDLDSGDVLMASSADKVLPIASITKLMSAVVALEQTNLDRTVVVPDTALVFTSRERYAAGQQVPAYDLIYPLLTESSNEAALTIAHDFGESRFNMLMNAMADSLGMASTTFVDAAGRGAGNVSTASDLAVLARYILEYRAHVFDITASRFGGNSYYGQPIMSDLGNFNFFASDETFLGGKTGQTQAANETMLAVFEESFGRSVRRIAYVVLGTDDSKDAIEMLRTRVHALYDVSMGTE